jgi:bifunctional DNA-binding transcriptional regulator/antitoxin component of YhaV-PrlF toxin-antitoxin module
MVDIVKLQKVKTREKNGREYYKYQITLPKKLIDAIGWEPGDELIPKLKGSKIQIEVKKEEEEEGREGDSI